MLTMLYMICDLYMTYVILWGNKVILVCQKYRSQWEMALLCNDLSHWLGANLESALWLLGPLLLILINFDPNMDKESYPTKVWD